MSKYLWIIDAGHGGLDEAGNYQCLKGGKEFTFPDGFNIKEGVINRAVAKHVYKRLGTRIDFNLIYDDVQDWPLMKRVDLTNKIYAKHKNAIGISIHSNAGGGKGIEIFTSKGETKSDVVAELFASVYKKNFPIAPFRADHSDGDSDKEENFTILYKTHCPFILLENFFFDNRAEAEFLSTEYGQQLIANTIVEAIDLVESKQPV